MINSEYRKRNSCYGNYHMSKMGFRDMGQEDIMPEYKTRVSYRTVGPNRTAGNLSCGFIYKPDDRGSNRDITFEYYGGLILLDGEGEYSDRGHSHVKLSRGSFVQRLPGVRHTTIVKPDGKWLEFFICISAESYHNLLSMGLMSDRPVMRCEENTLDEILPAAKSLLSSMQDAQEPDLMRLYFEAQQLLCTITSRCSRSREEDGCVELACRLIERCSGRITGQELAAQMHMGYEALRKQFRASAGISIGQYAIRVRVNRAKALLLRSDLPLEKLAVQLGYPDAFAFCKQFKQHTGVSPSQFRRMN